MAYIVVVDDEENIRFTLQAFLEGDGHTVQAVGSYEEALGLLNGEEPKPDVVFVDIILGRREGIDLVDYAREHGILCPMVIITGNPSINTASKSMRLGAFDYIVKPVDKEKLLHTTELALRHYRLEQDKRKLEAETERLYSELNAVFQSVPDAIITIDANLFVIQANQAAESLFGSADKGIIGLHVDYVFGAYKDAVRQVVEQSLEKGGNIKEYRVGSHPENPLERILVFNCSPLSALSSEFGGVVLVVRDITRLAGLEQELEGRRSFRNIVGKSKSMQEIYGLLQDLAETDTTVLITGPSGTGKELVAEALHYEGRRSKYPLIKVNCSALSENLLESELFGHVRGAFTGAVKDKLGRFQSAHKGTIFLDEIGDISPRIQLKLLRVLQEREFERVGDNETIKVDVRVIAATNQDLREKTASGEFREDLYYRLKVVETTMPALRERREDIPLLLEHFITMFNKEMEKEIVTFSDEAAAMMMNYPWPGNVRELKHAVEHAFVLCREKVIEARHLPHEIVENTEGVSPQAEKSGLEMEDILATLERTGGNKAMAARLLGTSRQTLYRKLREHAADI